MIYLTGTILSLAGFVLLKFPSKKINGIYGYRTSRSMKSQELWDFSQPLAGKGLIILGLTINAILLVVSIFIQGNSLAIVMIGLLISGCVVMIIITESILKKKEDELGPNKNNFTS